MVNFYIPEQQVFLQMNVKKLIVEHMDVNLRFFNFYFNYFKYN